MAQQKNPVVFSWHITRHSIKTQCFVAQYMAQQKTPVVFDGTEHGTAAKPGSFLVAQNMAQQNNSVGLCALYKGAVKG